IGPGQVLQALNSVRAVGLANREDFYWTLHSVFVNRRDQCETFDQAFHICWRTPDIIGRMMSLMLPEMGAMQEDAPKGEELSRRLAEALNPANNSGSEQQQDEEITLDATLTWSANQVLAQKDFEKMSSEEINIALAA